MKRGCNPPAFKDGGAPAQQREPDRCAIHGHGSHEHRIPIGSSDPRSVPYPQAESGLCDGDGDRCGEIVRIYEEYIENLIADEERSIARSWRRQGQTMRAGREPGSADPDGRKNAAWGGCGGSPRGLGQQLGFMLGFIALLLSGLPVNLAMGSSSSAFDPYPFILLNLCSPALPPCRPRSS